MDNTIIANGGQKLSVKQVLTYWQNNFTDKLISALIDLRHWEAVAAENPTFEQPIGDGSGKKAKVQTLVESKRNGVWLSRRHIQRISEMLGKVDGLSDEEAIKLLASDEAIGFIKSPFTDGK